MRRILLAVALLGLLSSVSVFAGDEKTAPADPMAAMANCYICKAFLPHMAELMPVMDTETITMSNGMATLTTVTDPAKVDTYHMVCKEMHHAGQECASFTAAEADQKLCPMCRQMWGLIEAGAELSYGTTATGDLMVLTSEDPVLQKKIVAMYAEWEKAMGS